MLRPCMSQITTKNESYYSIVIGVAKRARDISDELIREEKTLEEKPVKTAVDDLAARRYYVIEDPAVHGTKSE